MSRPATLELRAQGMGAPVGQAGAEARVRDLEQVAAVGVDRVEVRLSRGGVELREGDLLPVRRPDWLEAADGAAAACDRNLPEPAAVGVHDEQRVPSSGRSGREED